MRNVLFTGASGFLGNNILPILSKYDTVETMGLTNNDTYNIDLSIEVPQLTKNYQIVIHAAGKAHFVPKSENEKELFYKINLQGTKNLCKSLEKTKLPKSIIFISTVAVYGLDKGQNINKNLVYARVGNNMIARRQGMKFSKQELNLQAKFSKMNFINKLNIIEI